MSSTSKEIEKTKEEMSIEERNRKIGERLKELREIGETSITQNDLAVFLKCSKDKISKIEQGIQTINIHDAVRIADKYGVSLDWLLVRTEDKDNANNTLDTLNRFISFTTKEKYQGSYIERSYPSICIRPNYFKYLTNINKANGLKGIASDEMINVLIDSERKNFFDSLQNTPKQPLGLFPFDGQWYALLSNEYLSEKVNKILEESYIENNHSTKTEGAFQMISIYDSSTNQQRY